MSESETGAQPPADSSSASSAKRSGAIARAALLGLGFTLLVAIAWRLPLLHWLALGATWARGAGAMGALAGFAAIFTATVLLSPIVPLIVMSGWVWGPVGGLIAVSAATASAASSFSIARALGQTAVAQALRRSPRAAKIVALAESGGPLTVAILRFAPIIPFTPGNAAFGLTRLPLSDMIAGTVLGLLPGAIFYVWIGALLPDAESIERGEAMRMLLTNGWLIAKLFVAHLIVVGFAAWLARKMHAQSRPPIKM